MKLIPFTPGSIIELDDPTTGKRRLCFVCDTGTEFIDYVSYGIRGCASLACL
jgi:hypothetical protein